VGIILAYCTGWVLLLMIRCLELWDARRFVSATELLTRRFDRASVYQREEGGIHKYQNHLASVTYVKPGVRRWFLRVTLFLINLLARFWFNRGDLGGIPTILAARWVVIDGGKRLLFLTNYGGAWESYLNEFIDMGAVRGLNAVWSNTYVESAGVKYGFPKTKFYLWRGAEAAQRFKAYVRQSQVETIVWYSAYPTLSITNINANTDLRRALFGRLAPWQLDSAFHRAGL